MKENYLISILGRQTVEEETGEIELTTLGSYVERNGSRYIVYKEYAPEEGGNARTSILKVESSRKMTLMRGGADSTRLILEEGRRHLCHYDTGFGVMTVGVFTNRFHADLNDTGGRLEVSYTLDVNANLSSVNEITITVKEAKKEDVKTC